MSEYCAPIPTKIFHITCIDNLHAILSSGELSAKNILDQNRIKYRNIAYMTAQGNRKNTQVSLGKGGNLHDYVPFYFAPRSPMLDAIHHNKVDGYTDGQQNICHIVANVQKINEAKLPYVFTNAHPLKQPLEFFDSIVDIDQVDWELFLEPPLLDGYAQYWFDNHNEPNKPKRIDRKRRRQAEFLVYQRLKWEFVQEVGIINDEKATKVKTIFDELNIKTPIIVKPDWYYRDEQ